MVSACSPLNTSALHLALGPQVISLHGPSWLSSAAAPAQVTKLRWKRDVRYVKLRATIRFMILNACFTYIVRKIEVRSIGSKCTGFFCHFHAIHYEGKTKRAYHLSMQNFALTRTLQLWEFSKGTKVNYGRSFHSKRNFNIIWWRLDSIIALLQIAKKCSWKVCNARKNLEIKFI